jgi:hypothetical protein
VQFVDHLFFFGADGGDEGVRRILDLFLRHFDHVFRLLERFRDFGVSGDHTFAFVEKAIHVAFVFGDALLKIQQIVVGVLLKGAEHADARLAIFAKIFDHFLGMDFATDIFLDVDVEHVMRGRDLGFGMFIDAGFAHELVAFDAFGFCLLNFFID